MVSTALIDELGHLTWEKDIFEQKIGESDSNWLNLTLPFDVPTHKVSEVRYPLHSRYLVA